MPILLPPAAFSMTLPGGLVADRIGTRPHLVPGSAAGVTLGAVAFDLPPEAPALDTPEVHGLPLPTLTLPLAFLAIHIVERSVATHATHEPDYATHRHTRAAAGLTAGSALVLHNFLDGAATAAAYQTNTTLAVAVAIGVVAHDFTDGFNTYTVTSLYSNARRRALTPAHPGRPGPHSRRHPHNPPDHPKQRPSRLPGPFRRFPPLPGNLRYPP